MPDAPVPTPVTSHTDIDGDGRVDRVTLEQRGACTQNCHYLLTVTRAEGRTATMRVTVPDYTGQLTPELVWAGTAQVDGEPGTDFMLDLGGAVGDFPAYATYALRKDTIVNLLAPGPGRGSFHWNLVGPDPFPISGYTFSTSGRTRDVTWHQLAPSAAGSTYSGTSTRYRWDGRWVRVSSTPIAPIPAETATQRYHGWHGITWQR